MTPDTTYPPGCETSGFPPGGKPPGWRQAGAGLSLAAGAVHSLAAGAVLFLATGAVLCFTPGAGLAHPGELDEYGGHFNLTSGMYHYHKPRWDLVRRSREYLHWQLEKQKGELVGEVASVERPDAVWIHISYLPAYKRLAKELSKDSRNDSRQEIRLWLRYVSPEASAMGRDKTYREWFAKKVVYELDSKLRGKPVTAQFEFIPSAGKLRGLLFSGEENVNIWLILQGYSFYMLEKKTNPHDARFSDAEKLAQKDKVGLWAP